MAKQPATQADDDRLLTGPQAAELAGVKPSTWRAYVARGQAPAPSVSMPGKDYWRVSDLQRWLDTRPGKGGRPRSSRSRMPNEEQRDE